MTKNILLSIAIAIVITAIGFTLYVIGLYQAPERAPYDQVDEIQYLCDTARREPWKTEIQTSCDYMQTHWAIDYTCEEVIGCHTVARKAE